MRYFSFKVFHGKIYSTSENVKYFINYKYLNVKKLFIHLFFQTRAVQSPFSLVLFMWLIVFQNLKSELG